MINRLCKIAKFQRFAAIKQSAKKPCFTVICSCFRVFSNGGDFAGFAKNHGFLCRIAKEIRLDCAALY
ncbi:MAG TPA: hypothetical protein DER68_03425 [Ruminococcaceae bacterium]|nr:hypothetical protein [Oscillospiraceae bacterium]